MRIGWRFSWTVDRFADSRLAMLLSPIFAFRFVRPSRRSAEQSLPYGPISGRKVGDHSVHVEPDTN